MKRGTKPKEKVNIRWTPNFAYAVGLIATDGNLSPDGRHVLFTSKDKEMIDNFQSALGISLKYYMKANGTNSDKKYYVVQIGDVLFYEYLCSIGLTPNKSKTIAELNVPQKYYRDFIRGCFDGDGSSYSYWDKRWRSSFMLYLQFASASSKHIFWLRDIIFKSLKIKGHISKSKSNPCFQLKYAKTESIKLFNYMYKNQKKDLYLSRKYLKIRQSLAIVKGRENKES